MKSGMPQIDPCCFPILHPRGTLGWRFFMKKNGIGRAVSKEQLKMQEKLDESLCAQTNRESDGDDHNVGHDPEQGTSTSAEHQETIRRVENFDDELDLDKDNENIAAEGVENDIEEQDHFEVFLFHLQCVYK